MYFNSTDGSVPDIGLEFLDKIVLAINEHDHVYQIELEYATNPVLGAVLRHNHVLIIIFILFLQVFVARVQILNVVVRVICCHDFARSNAVHVRVLWTIERLGRWVVVASTRCFHFCLWSGRKACFII